MSTTHGNSLKHKKLLYMCIIHLIIYQSFVTIFSISTIKIRTIGFDSVQQLSFYVAVIFVLLR